MAYILSYLPFQSYKQAWSDLDLRALLPFQLENSHHSRLRCSPVLKVPFEISASTFPSRPRPSSTLPFFPPLHKHAKIPKPNPKPKHLESSKTVTSILTGAVYFGVRLPCKLLLLFFLQLASPPDEYPSIPKFSSILAATSSSPHLVVSRCKQTPHRTTQTPQ